MKHATDAEQEARDLSKHGQMDAVMMAASSAPQSTAPVLGMDPVEGGEGEAEGERQDPGDRLLGCKHRGRTPNWQLPYLPREQGLTKRDQKENSVHLRRPFCQPAACSGIEGFKFRPVGCFRRREDALGEEYDGVSDIRPVEGREPQMKVNLAARRARVTIAQSYCCSIRLGG